MRALPLITNSEVSTYRRCPREWHWAYGQGIRPVERAGSLRFGSLVHSGLESHWLGNGTALAACDSDAYEIERAKAMLDGYAIRWAADNYEVIGVEMQFRVRLVNPATGARSLTFELGGKLDALVRDANGEVWVCEHKTSSEDITAGSQYWAKLRMDSQVSTYIFAAREMGYEPRGVLYDVLKKPQQKPFKATPAESRKYKAGGDLYANQRASDETPAEYGERVRGAIAENPDAYYQRGTVVRLAEEEREAAADLWQYAGRIRDTKRTGIAPRNPDACQRYGRTCGYWAACVGESAIDNPARYVKVASVHQELTDAA